MFGKTQQVKKAMKLIVFPHPHLIVGPHSGKQNLVLRRPQNLQFAVAVTLRRRADTRQVEY